MTEYLLVTEQRDNHLRVYRQLSDGRLAQQQVVEIPGGPASLVFNRAYGALYVATRDDPGMNTYALGADNELGLVGRIALASDPCFTNVDRTGRWLLTTYFADGSVRINAINSDGLPVPTSITIQKTYVGAHCIHATTDNRYLFVPHVGSNRIVQYCFDQDTGAISPNDPAEVEPVGWQTPRHMEFHPRLTTVYTSNEKASSITTWALDRERGTLSELQTLSTLPLGWNGKNTCAQIHMRPDGRYVYVTNRGHDSLARFAIHPDTGLLSRVGLTPSEAIPRAFAIAASGQFLYVGGRDTGWLVAYTLDPDTGEPTEIERYPVGQRVMWVEPLSL